MCQPTEPTQLTDHEYRLLAAYALFSALIGFLSGIGFTVAVELVVSAVKR